MTTNLQAVPQPSLTPDNSVSTAVPVAAPAQKEFLADADKSILDLVKMQRTVAVAQAEKALAQNETAELRYNNVVLQLTMKYGLSGNDTITEQGEILRNSKESK